MPLSMVESSRMVNVISIQAGRGLVSRLNSMGITVGIELEVIQNPMHGPFIVGIKGTRIMLGRGVAHKIIVE